MPETATSHQTEMATPQVVWKWLTHLHALTAGNSSLEEAEARIGAVAPLIAGRFPCEAFTRRSLEHVAAASKFWPAYGELVDRLSAWWRDNRLPLLWLNAPEEPWRGAQTKEESENILVGFSNLVTELQGRTTAREMFEPKSLPLSDVSLKGDVLALARRQSGIATLPGGDTIRKG